MSNSVNNKLIAKNTLFLFIRMFITTLVTLYTSRIVLNTLGIEDYGIYSLVGGIVTMFGFFNSAMTSATQRFLAFDIGKNNLEQLKKTFNATLNIHIAISILVLILAETLGLWFVNYKLNLPINRMYSVNWVYQFSVFTFLLGIIQVPYDALIVAREKMKIYAYMSFIEVILKLIIVYVLIIFDFDKLILYSFLLFLVTFISRIIHKYYCKRFYEESIYIFYFDKSYYKVLLSYSGWNLIGNIASVARSQGVNILLNLFFGTILNASYGITMQVQNAVQTLVTSFQMAVNPQIIKYYADENKEQCLKLIFQSAKYSYFLMFIVACPIIYNIDFILEMWLKSPPKNTSIFIVLCLINLLIECISGPLMIGAQATGQIKWYQIVIGTLIFLNLPISYYLLKIYQTPELIFYTSIIISIISLLFRLYFLNNHLELSIPLFFKNVIFRIITTSITAIVVFQILNDLIFFDSQLATLILKSIVLITIILTSIVLIGINYHEKKYITKLFLKKLNIISKK